MNIPTTRVIIKENYNREYVLIQLGSGIINASVAAFISSYFIAYGVGNSWIGLLVALANIGVIILSPLFAKMTENIKSLSTIKLIKALCVIGVGISAVMLAFDQRVLTVAGYTLIYTIFLTFASLINTLSGELGGLGYAVNFGTARAVNSVVFAIGSPLLGIIISKWSLEWIVVFGMLGFIALFYFVGLVPLDELMKKPRSIKMSAHVQKGEVEEDEKNKGFTKSFKLFLLAIVLLIVSHTYINTFMLQMMMAVGGDSTTMSIAYSIGAFVQLPMMFGFEKLNLRFSNKQLLVFSAWFFMIKSGVTGMAQSVEGIYLANLFQVFAFAIYVVGSVYYINHHFNPRYVATGQAAGIAALMFGNVIGALTGGFLIDTFSVSAMQLVGTVSALLGAIIMTIAMRTK